MNDLNLPTKFAKIYKDFVSDFLKCGHRRYSLYGGRDSGKSYAAYQLAIILVMNIGNVICVRRYKNTLGDSSYSHICKIIDQFGLSDYFKCTTSPYMITCKLTGYRIYFKGLDNPEKIKSTTPPKGQVVFVLFEEAQEIPNINLAEEAISTFERGDDSLFRAMYLFNPPPSKKHFTNAELRESSDDDHLLALYTSYLDIPEEWVGINARKEIERLKKTNYKLYLHRYLGHPIASENAVFENVRLETITDEQIDKWIKDDEYLFCGLDFGYDPDPNAACMMKYDPVDRILYIFKEYHSNKKNNQEISQGLFEAGFSPDYVLTCDNDEKDIADLRSLGWYRAVSANKGPGSRDAGFLWLQKINKIVIDEVRTPYTASEFIEYHGEEDKYGEIKSIYPEGQKDHHIAAVRYATERLRKIAGM